MRAHEGQAWAMARGRVRNSSTGAVGNLVEWSRFIECKVFVGYERIGAVQLPKYVLWLKADTEQESNAVAVGGGQ